MAQGGEAQGSELGAAPLEGVGGEGERLAVAGCQGLAQPGKAAGHLPGGGGGPAAEGEVEG